MVPFEHDNQKAYTLLLRIEVALRECLRTVFEAELGRNWQKQLPGDLLKKIKDSQTDEMRPQFDFVRLGPLYYLTFGELLTVLRQKPAQSVMKKIGGENFLRQLENILTPRNAVSHSRPVSSVGLKTIETLYAQLETALTAAILAKLIEHPDVGVAQGDAVRALIPALEAIGRDLVNLPRSVQIPYIYKAASMQYWWSDDLLAGFHRTSIDSVVTLLEEYNALPGGVGSAGTRQSFYKKHDLKKRIQDALVELKKVPQ